MSIVPATRPRIKMSDALSRITPFAVGAWHARPNVMVIGIRGYYHDRHSDNQRGIYDDCICIVGPEHFSAYNANVDPSVFRKGVASLRPGTHRYRPGMHGISRPGGGYPAFRPATENEELPVERDGVAVPEPGVAINLHRGGRNTTSSLGCQTIPPDQWDAFHSALTDQLKRAGQKEFDYHLV